MLPAFVLFWLEIYFMVNFIKEFQRILASQAPNDYYGVPCAIFFVSFYILCILPAAKTVTEVCQMLSWVSVVWNIGLVVELKLGPFRKMDDALADMRRAILGERQA